MKQRDVIRIDYLNCGEEGIDIDGVTTIWQLQEIIESRKGILASSQAIYVTWYTIPFLKERKLVSRHDKIREIMEMYNTHEFECLRF